MEDMNYAKQWFDKANRETDSVNKFVFLWIAFNWLYSQNEYRIDHDEKKSIRNFISVNKKYLEKYDAFHTNEIDIFLQDKIHSELPGYKRTYDYNQLRNNEVNELFLAIYQVRCNLFHGSKSLRNDRDMKLVENSAIILKNYLHTLPEINGE